MQFAILHLFRGGRSYFIELRTTDSVIGRTLNTILTFTMAGYCIIESDTHSVKNYPC